MSNKGPHRHHYVPRMVQRNFTHEKGGLYFWRRGMAVGEVRSAKPSNLFVEDNLYTIVDEKGGRDLSVEQWFGRLESLAAPFIGQFLNIVRHGISPIMDPTYWDLWHVYNYHAQKRTVAWHTRFMTRDDLLTVMRQITTEEQWNEHLRAWEANPEDALREMNNARIASQVDPIPDDLLKEYRSRGLMIYVAPARTSFILGDEMSAGALISSQGSGPRTHSARFMPIAPDVAVGYCAARGVHINHVEAGDVRRMNEAMAKQSYLIAGRSQAQIASLSRIPYDPPNMLEGWFKSGDSAGH
jgi:hypothetical protein